MNQQTQQNQTPKKHDEMILVVKRSILFPSSSSWHGLRACDDMAYMETILAQKEFLPRSLAETEYNYKQIIPYLVFEYNGTYFLMKRHAKASETRLQSKYSMGIGGHIRETDLTTTSIADWAHREFHEEVNYSGNFTIKPLGILNDDTTDVGKVHIGFVYLLQGNSGAISPKEEFESAHLASLEECKNLYPSMETWSQIVLDFLTQ